MSDHFGNIGRFELYSIEFEKFSRELGRITIELGGQRETVYEPVDPDNIPTRKPLSLTGPREPITPYDPIYIIFGDPDRSSWMICIRGENEAKLGRIGVPITKQLRDPLSDSLAVLRYGITPKSIDAKLELKYEGDRVIEILRGEINATTAGVDATKRLLRWFGPTETSYLLKRSKKNPDQVFPGELVKLDRSLLAMPLGSALEVTVSLHYSLGLRVNNPADKKKTTPDALVSGAIDMTRSIVVPVSRSNSSAVFYAAGVPGLQLTLTVDWTDDLYEQDMELLNEVIPSMDVQIAELKEMGFDLDSHFVYLEEAAAAKVGDGAEASGGAGLK